MTIQQMKEAHQRDAPYQQDDPVCAHVELKHRAIFHPLGFPLELSSNSEEVIAAAAESWNGFAALFKGWRIRLRVYVHEGTGRDCPPTPVCRQQRHILANVADAETYSINDFAQGFTYAYLPRAVLSHKAYLRYFFLESAAMGHIANRYTTPIHAACLELDGRGILLCGDSGAGKSTLAYACAQAGWTYISDDASYLLNDRTDCVVTGNYLQFRFRPETAELFPELKGQPVTTRAGIGKPSVEWKSTAINHIKRAATSRIAYVVFLSRRSAKHQELDVFPKEVARRFIQQNLNSLPDVRATQETRINALLRLKTLDLHYHELSYAVSRLTRLIREDR
jgi:hypothetical protein